MDNEIDLWEKLTAGKSAVCPTKGTSMRPLLTQGKTTVLLEPIQGELKIGDMALFKRADDLYVLHRVIAIDGEYYITRGDNCLNAERNHRDSFCGAATAILYGKKRLLHISSRKYRAYLFAVEHTWFVRKRIFQLRELYRKSKRKLGRTKLGKFLKKLLRYDKRQDGEEMG